MEPCAALVRLRLLVAVLCRGGPRRGYVLHSIYFTCQLLVTTVSCTDYNLASTVRRTGIVVPGPTAVAALNQHRPFNYTSDNQTAIVWQLVLSPDSLYNRQTYAT